MAGETCSCERVDNVDTEFQQEKGKLTVNGELKEKKPLNLHHNDYFMMWLSFERFWFPIEILCVAFFVRLRTENPFSFYALKAHKHV